MTLSHSKTTLGLSVLMPLLALPLPGCVDGDDAREPTETSPIEDNGGRSPDCGQSPSYDKNDSESFAAFLVDDFELGAAGGTWFANNDVCERCQTLIDARDDLLATAEAGSNIDTDSDPSGSTDSDSVQMELASTSAELQACKEHCMTTQSPTIFDKPLPASFIQGGRCGSEYALHLETVPLIGWGANIGNIFPAPVDASAYDGISFWSRRAPQSRGVVRVELSDKFTDGEYDGEEGPYCSAKFTEDTLSEACDRFGAYALVSTDWNLFTIPFNEMMQAGWGEQAPYFDTAGIRSLTFLFPTGQWDIWIDDVAWYKRR